LVDDATGARSSVSGATATMAIEARGLTKRYGPIVALDGLDLAVPTGSVFGFLGPNGAGKTTTIRLLTGLGHPTSGSATVAGIPWQPADCGWPATSDTWDRNPGSTPG